MEPGSNSFYPCPYYIIRGRPRQKVASPLVKRPSEWWFDRLFPRLISREALLGTEPLCDYNVYGYKLYRKIEIESSKSPFRLATP